MNPIHSLAPGVAPPSPPHSYLKYARPNHPCNVPQFSYTDDEQRRRGLRVDFVDHWRMPAAQAHHFAGRMWSYWLRNPSLLVLWMSQFTSYCWDTAVGMARDAPFFDSLDIVRQDAAGIEQLSPWLLRVKGWDIWSLWLPISFAPLRSTERSLVFAASAHDGYSAARRWNAYAASRQSVALRVLIAATAHAELGGNPGRHRPLTLCGLRFDRVARVLASEGISARRVAAADVLTVRSERACEVFTMLEMRVERLIPPSGCGCPDTSKMACLVLLLMGDHVVARAWAVADASTPGNDNSDTMTATFSRVIPSGGALSPRVIVMWVSQSPRHSCDSCDDMVKPCQQTPKAFARMVIGNDPMSIYPWWLTDDTEREPGHDEDDSTLVTCFGATQRLVLNDDDDLGVPDTELFMLELDEVTAMIDACGNVGALLATRRQCGRWRLPPGTCGCGCRNSAATSICTMAHVAEVDEIEAPKDTQSRIASYLCTPTRDKQSERERVPLLVVNGRPFDLSDAAMDDAVNGAASRTLLARFGTEAL